MRIIHKISVMTHVRYMCDIVCESTAISLHIVFFALICFGIIFIAPRHQNNVSQNVKNLLF